MILESVCDLLFGLITLVIDVLPIPVLDISGGATGLTAILAYGLYFFPIDIWITVIGMGATMLTIGFGWAIIEWVYKKIPGVD